MRRKGEWQKIKRNGEEDQKRKEGRVAMVISTLLAMCYRHTTEVSWIVLTWSSKTPDGITFMSTITVNNVVMAASENTSHTNPSVFVTVSTQVWFDGQGEEEHTSLNWHRWPVTPGRQVQIKNPGVFSHVPPSWQGSKFIKKFIVYYWNNSLTPFILPREHSSMSFSQLTPS